MIDESIFELYYNNYVLAGTGSRSFTPTKNIKAVQQVYTLVKEAYKQHRDKLVICSGGAQGFDHFLTEVAINCNIPYVLILPNPNYISYYWDVKGSIDHKDHMSEATDMINKASMICTSMPTAHGSVKYRKRYGAANFDRNDDMVALADEFIVYNPIRSGTLHCYKEVQRKGSPHTVIWEKN